MTEPGPSWYEQALQFSCGAGDLLGIVSRPGRARATGVLIIVGGPQYRVGSHRQFVLLARHLASQGFAAMRFDYRGMGDSLGAPGHFEQVTPDIDAALTAFQAAVPEVQRFVLWGLCDGASAALLYLNDKTDARVAGLVLLNPWVRTVASQARTQVRHYYLQRLMQQAFWRKLLGGQVAKEALGGFVASLRTALRRQPSAPKSSPKQALVLSYPDRMARGWLAATGPLLLMLSDQDYTAREFESYCSNDPAWQHALRARPPQRVALSQADHTCSQPGAETAMHQQTAAFLSRVCTDLCTDPCTDSCAD